MKTLDIILLALIAAIYMLAFRWERFGRYIYRHDFVRGLMLGFSIAALFTISNALLSGLWHINYGYIISWAIAIVVPSIVNVWLKKHLSERNIER